MPLVVANESGTEQTESCAVMCKRCGVVRHAFHPTLMIQSFLERNTREGDSPVEEIRRICMYLE